MRCYRKAVTKGVLYEIGQFIYVVSEDGRELVAYIYEIRACDCEDIYLAVLWMYRPDELRCGRQPYHGKDELIASNDMAIIHVCTINGKVCVNKWDGQIQTALYWRQTLDVSYSPPKLSTIENVCICNQPQHPDKELLQCDKCRVWLHDDCVVRHAAMETYRELGDNKPYNPRKRAKEARPIDPANDQPTFTMEQAFDAFKVSLVAKAEPAGVDITDCRKNVWGRLKSWRKPLQCLACQDIIS